MTTELRQGHMDIHTLRNIQEQCWYLSCGLSQVPDKKPAWHTASDWLTIASGIEKIEFDMTRFDGSVGWCSQADEYNFKRSDIISDIVFNLSIFNYIWACFEAVCDIVLRKSDINKHGKVNAACLFLKKEYLSGVCLPLYKKCLESFFVYLGESKYFNDVFLKLKISDLISFEGLGIHAVYKIRNKFAHGAASFPQPDDEEERPIYREIINSGSEIVILTIQYLVLSYFKNQKTTIWCPPEYQITEESQDILLDIFFREVHLEIDRSNENEEGMIKQLVLFEI